MNTEDIQFYSDGVLIRGVIHRPDGPRPANGWPVVVEGPAWLSLSCASGAESTSEPYHAGLVRAGFAVLTFDYRGFGRSDGDRGWIAPDQQVADMTAGVTFVETVEDLDSRRVGLFGVGALGAGNAIVAAARDDRVKSVAVQTPIADGGAWLRSMRGDEDWYSLLRSVAGNRRKRVLGGPGLRVDPRNAIMVATHERKQEESRSKIDELVGDDFELASVEHLLRYRPLDVISSLSPRSILIAVVEHDPVTPAEHGRQLYAAAGPPKRLIVQRDVTHYESYRKNLDYLLAEVVTWFERYLTHTPISIHEEL